MTHPLNIVGVGMPTRLDLGGNYHLEIMNVVVKESDAGFDRRMVHAYAYIFDGGESMPVIALNVALMVEDEGRVTIDMMRIEAIKVIKEYRGLNRLLNAIYNEDD